MLRDPQRAAGLSLISVLGRAPGFLVPVLIAATFGAGRDTDAYFLSYAAALFIGGVISQAVEVAIVPFAAREIDAGGVPAKRFLDRTARRTGAIATALWVIVVSASWACASPDLGARVARYGVCFAPLVVAWCASAVYSGGLISRDAIGAATGSIVLRGAGGILALLVVPRAVGLAAVAVGLGLGEVARAALMRKKVLSLVTRKDVASRIAPAFGRAATAQVAAVAVNGMAPLGERVLAASLVAGSVSHLEYGSRLLFVPQLIFDGALAPLLLSKWSRAAAIERHPPSSREVLVEVLRGGIVAIVLAAILASTGGFWVRLLLHHGRFTDLDAQLVSSFLRVLCIGFVFSMGAVLLERFFIATAQNRTLARLSILRLVTRLGVALTTLPRLGLLAFGAGFAAAECVYLGALIGCLVVATRGRRPVGVV